MLIIRRSRQRNNPVSQMVRYLYSSNLKLRIRINQASHICAVFNRTTQQPVSECRRKIELLLD